MEMPEQELPIMFSQMSQMFPNIPQDIIWLYVHKYSRDIEKCTQMLNLQNSKYTELKSTLDSSKNLDVCKNMLQESNFKIDSETTLGNNNEVPLPTQLLLLNRKDNVNKCTISEEQSKDLNCPSNIFLNALPENNFEDSSKNTHEAKYFCNYNEPLVLDIIPDDDDISHSWRPNVSSDILCSDLFARSPLSNNFQLNNNLIPCLNFEHNNSEILPNSDNMNQGTWRADNSYPVYTQQNVDYYERDIASYVHYQKSQMNVIRYEVIKAKLEQSDLKEEIEQLSSELKEKMQSKSVQDIEELNKEIVELRIECQCLCTDVDQLLNDEGLLGEIDERFYQQTSFSNSTGTQNTACCQCTNSHKEKHANDIQDDSDKWQCPKCTFANHSAISICEMCSTPKPNKYRSPFMHAPQTSCYCHPKEKSLPVQS